MKNIFYMYSNMDGSSQILLFLIVLVGLMLLSILIINAITKKKNEAYDKKFNPINKYAKVMEKEKQSIKVEPKKEIKIEKELPKKEEIIEEVKPIEKMKIETPEEVEVIEVVSEENSIDKIAQLLEDNAKPMDPINLTRFEEEQEKNAIISYDELVKRAGSKKIVYKTEKEVKPIKEEKIEIKEEPVKGKFRASAVISPIYGVQKEKKEEIEEFIDVEDMPIKPDNNLTDEELQQDITFLGNLKTFRSNLD